MHGKYIPFDTFPTRCNITQFIYIWKTALYVSGGISTHHQEYTQLYLQYLVLVNRYCYVPLLWESWSWPECGVGIVLICIHLIHFQRDVTLRSLFISGKLLYMFRVVSPPIIRSTRNCIYSIWHLLTVTATCLYCGRDDGWRYNPEHVEQFSRNK